MSRAGGRVRAGAGGRARAAFADGSFVRCLLGAAFLLLWFVFLRADHRHAAALCGARAHSASSSSSSSSSSRSRLRPSSSFPPAGGEKDHHHHHHPRRRRLPQPRRVIALALQGDPGCDYTTKLDIGGTVLDLIVDTGSSNLAVVAAQCTTCASVPSPRYRNTRRWKGEIGVTYGTPEAPTSWSGVITSDVIKFPVPAEEEGGGRGARGDAGEPDGRLDPAGPLTRGFRGTLAAITENVNFFNPVCPSSHGIWGMAFRNLASAKLPTLFDTIVEHGVPDGFAMQLCPTDGAFSAADIPPPAAAAAAAPPLAAGSRRRTGSLWLGGVDSSKLAEPFRYVPLVARDWYQVRLDSIRLGGRDVPNLLPLSDPKAIVDSGTTDIILSSENYHSLVSALYHSDLVKFSPRVPKQYVHDFWFKGNSLRLPSREYAVDPSAGLEVVVDGVVIPIDVANVVKVTPYGGSPGYVDIYWAGFSPGGAQGSGVGTILGETLFVGKVVFFDRVPRPNAPLGRIGFAEGKDCYGRTSSKAINIFAGQEADGGGPADGEPFSRPAASDPNAPFAAALAHGPDRFWMVATTLSAGLASLAVR